MIRCVELLLSWTVCFNPAITDIDCVRDMVAIWDYEKPTSPVIEKYLLEVLCRKRGKYDD